MYITNLLYGLQNSIQAVITILYYFVLYRVEAETERFNATLMRTLSNDPYPIYHILMYITPWNYCTKTKLFKIMYRMKVNLNKTILFLLTLIYISSPSFSSFFLPDMLCNPTELIWRQGNPFEAMTGCTTPSSDGLLAEVFLSCKANPRRSVHSPWDHFINILIISDYVTLGK